MKTENYKVEEITTIEAKEINAGGGMGIFVGWIGGILHYMADNAVETSERCGPYGQHILFN